MVKSLILVTVLALFLSIAIGAKINSKTKVPKEGDAAPVSIPAGFVKLAHKVSSGEIIIKNTRTILIKSFSYDGAGPDAYFWVGKGKP